MAGPDDVTPGERLIAVVGPSGSGKSSVVKAGLIPDWVIQKLDKAPNKQKASIELFADTIKGLRDICDGVHIITLGGIDKIQPYLDAAKIR